VGSSGRQAYPLATPTPLGAPPRARETSRFLQHDIAPQTQVELPVPLALIRRHPVPSRRTHPLPDDTQILPILLPGPSSTRQPWIPSQPAS
jgi:hypothetical protein